MFPQFGFVAILLLTTFVLWEASTNNNEKVMTSNKLFFC